MPILVQRESYLVAGKLFFKPFVTAKASSCSDSKSAAFTTARFSVLSSCDADAVFDPMRCADLNAIVSRAATFWERLEPGFEVDRSQVDEQETRLRLDRWCAIAQFHRY